MRIVYDPHWNRANFPKILTEHGYQVGAEIGVQAGLFSDMILSGWPGKLYMIDCWQQQPPEVYHDIGNVPNDVQEQYFQQAQVVSMRHAPRGIIIRDFSPQVADMFSDGALDWTYLDDNHSFSATLANLKAWWPKIKPGGLMCGHDFLDEISHGCEFRVIPAVRDFFPENQTVYAATETWPSWLVFKEKS